MKNKFLNNLKTWAEENPAAAITIATVATIAASRIMDANTARSNSKAWTKEVDRRSMKF